MTYFEEEFYTDDFDQGMMDFIENNLITPCIGYWDIGDEFLKYGIGNDYFWTSNSRIGVQNNYLTKEQFKKKIGMTKKDTNVVDKGMLKTGMIVEVKCRSLHNPSEESYLAMVLLDTKDGDIISGGIWMDLENSIQNIQKVYQPRANLYYLTDKYSYGNSNISIKGCDLIWERPSPEQIEIDKLESEKEVLQKKIDALKEKL